MISSFFLLFLFQLLSFFTIIGYGKFLAYYVYGLNQNHDLIKKFKLIEFVLGLLIIGSIGILLNFYFSINDYISAAIFFLGIIFYFIFFINIRNKKEEILIIIIIVLLATFFSHYSLFNDDFDYHFQTINNFKNFPTIHNLVLDVNEGRRFAYNSHWLMLNAIFYITKFPESLFSITSLLYLLSIHDFFYSFKRNFKNNNFLPLCYSSLIIVFLIGVLNQYKEYGTDLPGQILLLFIFLIYFETSSNNTNQNNHLIYFILFSISSFAFILKISNIFIFLLIGLLFLKIRNKLIIFFKSIFLLIPLFLWLIQNYIISKCLIWPISLTCFQNQAEAKYENFVIEVSAKRLLDVSYTFEEYDIILNNFSWIPHWFNNIYPKYTQTYGIYLFLFVIAIIILNFLNNSKKKILQSNFSFFKKLDTNNNFLFYSLISIISFIFWFIKAPDYRFGVVYNLNLIIIILMPFWFNVILINKKYFYSSMKIIFSLSLIFFLYANLLKYEKYKSKFKQLDWPNIINERYINE